MDSPVKAKRNQGAERPKVLYAGTSPLSAQWFMRGQLRYLREAGFDVTVVTAPGPGLDLIRVLEEVNTIGVPMTREIAPLQDSLSMWSLWQTMRLLRPIITNVGTPKAGLLGGISSWVCRVPCRIYTLHGLRCETTTGLKRRLLLLAERIACLCAHRVLCVSESLRQRAITLGIVDAGRSFVLGSGSFNGINAERFDPTPQLLQDAAEVRQQLGIPRGAPVVGFVGRLTRDKGIAELIEAYLRLRGDFSELRLLLIGDFEKGDPLPPEIHRYIESESRIIHTGFVQDAPPYYHVMDVLALPTYREGFPGVVLEAHAAGKPVVATRATGVVDAVVDGVTGLLVPIGDSAALAEGCARLLKDPKLASAMGRAGRERVLHEFRQEAVWGALLQEYLELLADKALPLPAAPATGSVQFTANALGEHSSCAANAQTSSPHF